MPGALLPSRVPAVQGKQGALQYMAESKQYRARSKQYRAGSKQYRAWPCGITHDDSFGRGAGKDVGG